MLADECTCHACTTDDLLIPPNKEPPPPMLAYWNDVKPRAAVECTPEAPCAWCNSRSVNIHKRAAA